MKVYVLFEGLYDRTCKGVVTSEEAAKDWKAENDERDYEEHTLNAAD